MHLNHHPRQYDCDRVASATLDSWQTTPLSCFKGSSQLRSTKHAKLFKNQQRPSLLHSSHSKTDNSSMPLVPLSSTPFLIPFSPRFLLSHRVIQYRAPKANECNAFALVCQSDKSSLLIFSESECEEQAFILCERHWRPAVLWLFDLDDAFVSGNEKEKDKRNRKQKCHLHQTLKRITEIGQYKSVSKGRYYIHMKSMPPAFDFVSIAQFHKVPNATRVANCTAHGTTALSKRIMSFVSHFLNDKYLFTTSWLSKPENVDLCFVFIFLHDGLYSYCLYILIDVYIYYMYTVFINHSLYICTKVVSFNLLSRWHVSSERFSELLFVSFCVFQQAKSKLSTTSRVDERWKQNQMKHKKNKFSSFCTVTWI